MNTKETTWFDLTEQQRYEEWAYDTFYCTLCMAIYEWECCCDELEQEEL